MNKSIDVTHDGKVYTLEFTRRTVQWCEAQGFRVNGLTDTPQTSIPLLFKGAFRANYPFMKDDKIEEVYYSMKRRAELVGKIAEMYSETVSALFDETPEGQEEDSENPGWVASF